MNYWLSNGSTVLVLVLVVYHLFTFSSKEFKVSLVKVGMIILIAGCYTLLGEETPALVWSASGLLYLLLTYMRISRGDL